MIEELNITHISVSQYLKKKLDISNFTQNNFEIAYSVYSKFYIVCESLNFIILII